MATRRRLRFGLKSLLALMTVCCLWFGYYASQASHRRQAVEHIAKLGGATWKQGQLTNPKTTNSGSLWSKLAQRYEDLVCKAFGDELRRDVVAVDLGTVLISEKDLAQLRPLDEIEWLTISGEEIDDAAAEQLQAFYRLRWLDISNSRISMDGINKLKDLKSLEWLNIAGTQIVKSEYALIQSMFPDAEIGSTSIQESVELQPGQLAQGESGKTVDSLWSDLLDKPYSKNNLTEYLHGIQRSSAVTFPQWYISAVYRANRKAMKPLLIIQVYNGTRGGFNLGCLLVFGPDGRLLREIAEERVHWSLRGTTKQVGWSEEQTAWLKAYQLAVSQQQVIDLLDFTGDGFDEIPTQRWNQSIGRFNNVGKSTSIYTSKTNDIPCLFCIATPSRIPGELLIDLTSIHPRLVYHNLDSGKLFLQSPCYAPTPTGTALILHLPQRTLATFNWSESANTFLGPTNGPQNTWKVIDRE